MLFYQAMFSFGEGLQVWIFAGMAAAVVVLAGVSWAVLKLGRTLPVKRFLTVALVIVMFTSIAVLGNAMRALQEAAIIDLHYLEGWPSLPIYLAQATGYYPTLPSVLAQGILLARVRDRRRRHRRDEAASRPAARRPNRFAASPPTPVTV